MIFTKMTIAIIICLAYILSLIIIFFTKKYVRNEETIIYRFLLILNSIGLFIHLIAENVCFYYDKIPYSFSFVILKAMLVYYFLFGIVLFTYSLIVVKTKKNEQIRKIINIFSVIMIIVFLLLPLHVYRDVDSMKFYTYGTDVILTYIVSGLLVSVMIVLLTVKHRDISMKKALPLLIFFIGGGISMIIQLNYPHITLIDLIESVICCMMYFTIENPDVKMVQQLKLAKEEADKANAAKTDFLSSMSHEIRTPLNAIVGFSDLVSEAKTLDEAKTNAKDIVNASQTLLEIVNGILDISKIEAGKLEIKESPYNAKETFEDLAKLIKPRMEEKGLDFSYFIAPDIPTTLYGDHANVKKIVTNFLSNAAKYTEKGYVKYEVNCINANGTCKLIVSVEDSGRGIKKEDVNKLFEKFDRLDVERNTTVEGTGLGMAITKQLVEMMGGKIIVHTVYGEGSKFTVMLDQKISDEQIQEAEKVSGDLNLSGIKILLVDDNDLNIKVGCKLLEKFNANLVSTAKDGFECIDKVKNNQYDLILLDDMMPKKSGTETLKDLKEIPGFNTPVIALTANAIAGMRESYLAAGFDEYLAKPIERQDLIKAVNKLLADKLSAGPVEEATHVVDNAYPTNATEAPTEETNTVIDNNQIPIPVEPTRESDEEFLRNRGVDMDKALELLGDMEMYNMTMEDFAQELENKWSKLEQEKLQNDMENYAIDVHSLKSDCKYLGFYNLADVAYEHELKSKENDSTFVNDNFERLANEYLKVLNIVKEYKDRLK